MALAACSLLAGPLTSVVRADRNSGKLVRVVLPAGPAAAHPDGALSAAVDRIASEHSVPPELIHSVIQAESNYNPFAVSAKGALGIMQLVPETARRFGVADVFNPEDNIRGGAKYLKYLLDLYHGDYPLALAAYNAGEGAVARHGGMPPYGETRNYVSAVLKRAGSARQKPGGGAEAPAPQPSGSEFNRIQQIVEPDGSVRYVSR